MRARWPVAAPAEIPRFPGVKVAPLTDSARGRAAWRVCAVWAGAWRLAGPSAPLVTQRQISVLRICTFTHRAYRAYRDEAKTCGGTGSVVNLVFVDTVVVQTRPHSVSRGPLPLKTQPRTSRHGGSFSNAQLGSGLSPWSRNGPQKPCGGGSFISSVAPEPVQMQHLSGTRAQSRAQDGTKEQGQHV